MASVDGSAERDHCGTGDDLLTVPFEPDGAGSMLFVADVGDRRHGAVGGDVITVEDGTTEADGETANARSPCHAINMLAM